MSSADYLTEMNIRPNNNEIPSRSKDKMIQSKSNKAFICDIDIGSA